MFLDSLGCKYSSYNTAIKKLDNFINSHRVEYPMNYPDLGEIEVDFDKGLFIYLVTNPSDTYTTLEGELIYNQKILVHFFNAKFERYWGAAFDGLRTEFIFFKTNNLDTAQEVREIKTSDNHTSRILSSPIAFQ